MQRLLSELGITRKGSIGRDGTYVVDIVDSDEYGKYFSILDKNSSVKKLEEMSQLTIHGGNTVYRYKDSVITLVGDYDQDSYKLVVAPVSQSQLGVIGDESDDDDNDDDNYEEETEDEEKEE